MLKFFRTIRQDLLKQNKVGQYITYALGEILLVVVGILIALQLNNWRENNKNKQTECTYLTSLSTDLERQTEAIDAQIQFEADVANAAELMMESYYEAERFIVDSSYVHRINVLNNRHTFRISNSTFQELLSTGSMNIISNDALKSKLLNYYQVMQRHEKVISRNNEFLDNNFVPLVFDLSPHETPEYSFDLYQQVIEAGLINPEIIDKKGKESYFFQAIEEKLNTPLSEMGLLNRVEYRHRVAAIHLSLMLQLKDLGNSLIQNILIESKNCSAN